MPGANTPISANMTKAIVSHRSRAERREVMGNATTGGRAGTEAADPSGARLSGLRSSGIGLTEPAQQSDFGAQAIREAYAIVVRERGAARCNNAGMAPEGLARLVFGPAGSSRLQVGWTASR